MPGQIVTLPVTSGDATFPLLTDQPYIPPVLGARYDWAADGLPVGALPHWDDLRQGKQFVAPTPSQRPVVDDADGDYLTFDGISQRIDAAFEPIDTPYTVVFVGKMPTVAASKYFFSGAGGSQHNLGINASTLWAFQNGANIVHTLPPDTDWHVHLIVINGASSVYSIDGDEVTGSAGSNPIDAIRRGASSTTYFETWQKRHAIIPFAADVDQRASIITTLMDRYGI